MVKKTVSAEKAIVKKALPWKPPPRPKTLEERVAVLERKVSRLGGGHPDDD